MSAAEGASEASSPEQANEWAVRANERMDERVTQYLRLDSWLIQTTVRRHRESSIEFGYITFVAQSLQLCGGVGVGGIGFVV